MEKYFTAILSEIRQCDSPAEVRLNIVSTLRLLLQHVCYGTLEWLSSTQPSPDSQPDQTLLHGLRQPSDGTLVDAMGQLLYWCERAGWSGIAQLPFRSFESESPVSRFCGDHPTTLDGLMRAFVALRNDGGEGHGLAGGFDPEAECAAVEVAVHLLREVLPERSDGSDALLIGPPNRRITLSIVRLWSGRPALIRKLQRISAPRVRVIAQVQKGISEREDLRYEANDPFAGLLGNLPPAFEVWAEGWKPFAYLPERLTDTFTGREIELSKLSGWVDDEDSRTCLVYGDGGLGKTTLVLEFLHRWLDGNVATGWKPSFISFYTAKRWRWGVDGIEVLRPGAPHMMDLIAHLHRLFFDSHLSIDWYRLDLSNAVQRLAGQIREQHKINRDEHLIVIDNAETLIESEENREQLAGELREISRRLGRVILTSRRREYLEASPIEIRPLTPEDAVKFLNDRGAVKLKLRSLRTAGREELTRVVKQLECRPLVLDAFLRALTDPATNTVNKAIGRVNTMLSRDLGRFLFDDAWRRLDDSVKRLLVVMTSVADVHDATLFRLCCDQLGTSVANAELALDESRGIASVSRVGTDLQIEFSTNFVGFASGKRDTALIDSKSVNHHVKEIKRRYSDYMRSARTFVGDRLSRALRHPSARAAHLAQLEGRIADAQKYYEEAVLGDSTNGWLLERYADFLFRKVRHLEAALMRALQATELLRNEGEVWFTRGIIEARLGRRQQFEGSFERAEQLGVSRVRCALQKAWGYTRCRPPQLALCEQQLDIARRQPSQDRYFENQQVEISRIEDRVQRLRAEMEAHRAGR